MIEQLGPYQVKEQIGKGGMGTVYKAYHPALDRMVAIKVLAQKFSSDQSFLARFKKEAQMIARLEHPHILPVYDFAFDGEIAYLVMKLVKGSSLTAHIKPGGMPPENAMRVLEAVAQALTHAHQRNIVHRDIKPDNILTEDNDWIYLSDFGMAKMLTSSALTSQHIVMGTPEYMSPEQAKANPVDHRADIYSLTILIYHMLTGYLPFKGRTPMQTIHQVLKDPFPEVTKRKPDLPRVLDTVLQKGASKKPAERYAEVSELVKMVAAVLTSSVAPEVPELLSAKYKLAVVPFSSQDEDKAWMGEAIQEMLSLDLSQSPELCMLAGDSVSRMCRNLSHGNSSWTPELMQRFFELSGADYIIWGGVQGNQIEYEIRISTTIEVVEKGKVEGSIPFHLIPLIAQKVRSKLEVKEMKMTSVEQLFHGNLALLQYYSKGVRAYREGRFLDADRILRLALTNEPKFAPAHLYLSLALQNRTLKKQAEAAAQSSMLHSYDLPSLEATFVKARAYGLVGKYEESVKLYRSLYEQLPDVTEYLVFVGEALAQAGQLEKAENIFYELCEKESKSGLGWERLAWIESLQKKYEQAWYHYKRAEKFYGARENLSGLTACYFGLAEISETRDEWNTAIDYYQRAVAVFLKIQWLPGIAKAKYRLGLAFKKQHQYSEALSRLRESMSLYREIGELLGEFRCIQEIVSQPVPSAEALELIDRALMAAAEMQEDDLVLMIIPFKLTWLVKAGQPDVALQVYASYYDALWRGSPHSFFPSSQIEIARALIQQQRLSEAQQHIEQAIRTLKRTNGQETLVSGLVAASELSFLQGRPEVARDYLRDADLIASKLANKELQLEVHLADIRLLQAAGDTVRLLQVNLNAVKLAEILNRSDVVHQLRENIKQLRA